MKSKEGIPKMDTKYFDSIDLSNVLVVRLKPKDEIREKIFEPFFTTKDTGKNVGLGLFICQEIARSYNGSVDVESELGKGSTFTVRLSVYKG